MPGSCSLGQNSRSDGGQNCNAPHCGPVLTAMRLVLLPVKSGLGCQRLIRNRKLLDEWTKASDHAATSYTT